MAEGADTDPHDVGLAETVSPVPDGGAPTIPSDPAPAEGLGDRPVSDRLVRAVSRAKIAGALFASEERVKLGRYHLLELVGSGGMGVVWGAWDPELDRRVAIKLVKATMLAARERILLEGQALAKLSHPNVVPVFDVGVVEEQVYLVMEWVRGKNLRAYCKEPRTVREIVAVYRDAALGLAAAHHAGLIHRDFKPDNAIRGDDGRVRVLDFGLARGETRPKADAGADAVATPTPSSDLTRGAGTPRYMPPEQAQGGALTPAVDQYAWCVSLREALVGRNADGKDADVPGWLDVIIARGTNPDSKARYPSMDELVRALARDPRAVWRRRAIVTGALGLAGAAFAIGTVRGGSEPERCVGGKAEIAKVWNPSVRDGLGAKLAALSPFAAEEAPKLVEELEHYGTTWERAHHSACLAKDRGELPAQMYERTIACFARSRSAFAAVIDVLDSVSAAKVADAVVAANSLPDAARCATDSALSAVALPSPQIAPRVPAVADEVERARVLALAADDGALTAAKTALDHATALAYQPLLARAYASQGMALMSSDYGLAAASLAKAVAIGLEAGDDPLATEAYARQVYAAAVWSSRDVEQVVAQITTMEPIARRTGAAGQFARALLYMNLGTAKVGAGDRDGAREWFARSRSEVDAAGLGDNAELAFLPSNTAGVVDDLAERDRLLAETVSVASRILGANHPVVLGVEGRVAMFSSNPATTTELVSDLCDRYGRFHPDYVLLLQDCNYELGWFAIERGDDDEAHRRMQAAAALAATDSLRGPIAVEAAKLFGGDARSAASGAEQFAVANAKAEGWEQMYVGDAQLVCGLAQERLGARSAALACDRNALDIFTVLESAHPGLFARRLARVRGRLALVLERADPSRARTFATEASRWYRGASGYERLVAELDRIAGLKGSP